MPSPMYTLGGSFMKSFTTSYLISGASIALGSNRCWACVRPPGAGACAAAGAPAGGAWPWATSVTPADNASAAATKLFRRIFMEHLDSGAESSPVRVDLLVSVQVVEADVLYHDFRSSREH